jgi:hypothetical protein
MLEELIQNIEQVVSESERIEQNLISEIEQAIESAEEGISESLRPDVYLVVGPYEKEMMDRLSRGERLLALSIAYSMNGDMIQESREQLEQQMDELERLDDRIVQAVHLFLNMENSLGIFSGASASYNPEKHNLRFNKLPPSFFSGLNPPEVLKPVLEYLEEDEVSVDSLKATINHELTHAYVEEKTGYDNNRKELEAIDEAAAYAVGNIKQASIAATEAYQVQGIERNLMHSAQKIMLDIANSEDNKQQAITNVRGKAAEAIQRLQKDASLDPIQVLREEDDREVKMLRVTAYAMEITEMKSLEILDKLSMIPPDKMSNFTQHLSIGNRNIETDDGLFPFYSKVEEQREDFVEALESGEDLRTTEEEIEKGIKDLESLIQNGNLSEEEREAASHLKSDLEEALNVYNDTDFQIYEIAERVFAEGILTSPKVLEQILEDKNHKQKLELLLEKYLEIVQAGEEDNQKIFQALKQLHDDEEKSAKIAREHSNKQEFRDIERMNKATEEAYNITKNAQGELQEAEEILETALQKIDEI